MLNQIDQDQLIRNFPDVTYKMPINTLYKKHTVKSFATIHARIERRINFHQQSLSSIFTLYIFFFSLPKFKVNKQEYTKRTLIKSKKGFKCLNKYLMLKA